MKQFHKACVMHFQPNCKEHMNAENLNDDYPFHKDSYLIIQFLKNLHFNKNINITEHDCKELIVEGKLMVGVDFITDDLDKYQYLFDAFGLLFQLDPWVSLLCLYVSSLFCTAFQVSLSMIASWWSCAKNIVSVSVFFMDLCSKKFLT